ncbi:MAG TPA: hypothetical protein VK065_03575, partial [Brevibacterium sp.]|nr:hypothetical protein [Brevibacterium sp.]
MTSMRLPGPTATHAPRRPVATGAALGTAVALGLLAGCDATNEDDRPASDYATLAEELRALPSVTCVEHATTSNASGGAEATPTAEDGSASESAGPEQATGSGQATGASATEQCPSTAEPSDDARTTYTVVLDPGTGEAELRTAAKRSDALVNDHRYPSGAPDVTAEYGTFTAEIPHTGRAAGYEACADACGGRLDFTDFLDLERLPDVRAGALTDRGADVVLADGTDPHAWVEEALATDAHLHLTVHTAQERDSEWLTLSLGADGTAESVTALLEIAESTGAEIVTASEVQNIEHASATLRVGGTADIPRVHDALVAEYPRNALDGFEIVTEAGFEVLLSSTGPQIDVVMDAHSLLEDAGAEVTRLGGRASYVELVAPDSEALSAVVERVSGASWPLPADTAVRIRQSHDSEYQASFEAGNWDERAPLLRDLWDAGFVEVEYRDDYGDLSTALV